MADDQQRLLILSVLVALVVSSSSMALPMAKRHLVASFGWGPGGRTRFVYPIERPVHSPPNDTGTRVIFVPADMLEDDAETLDAKPRLRTLAFGLLSDRMVKAARRLSASDGGSTS